MALMQDLIYTDGQSLKTVLKPDTYTKLEEHCASRSIPLPAINNMQVGLASVTLTMLELQRLGIAGTGVDEYFSTKAMQDGKTLAALETSEQQLTYLKQMGKGKEDQFILYTLNDVENLPNIMRAIKDAWRTGDSQQLEKLAVLPYINEFPGIYQSLLVKRNQAWLEKIKTMLATPEVEFVLFGALHLIGDQGVIEQLKSAGYQVEMM